MRQPIPLGPGGTSNASGALTLNYQQVPTGQTWIGTVSIPLAPAGTVITAYIAGLSIATWSGANTYGPITVGAGDFLQLVISNLVPSTSYQASWNGVAYTNEDGPIVWPASNTSTSGNYFPEVQLGSFVIPIRPSYSFHISLQSSWQSLYVNAPATVVGVPTSVLVIGDQSGVTYLTFQVNGFQTSPTVDTAFQWLTPLPNGLDTTVTVTIGADALVGSGVCTYGYSFAPAFQAVYFPSTISVNASVSGGSVYGVGEYEYGGNSRAAVPAAINATTSLLSAPAGGKVYRIHSVSMWGNVAATCAVGFGDATSRFAELHAGTQNQFLCGGLLWPRSLDVQNYTAVAVNVAVQYDIIAIPTIS